MSHKYVMNPGDIIRVQLNPTGVYVRWRLLSHIKGYEDTGSSDYWVDALVTHTSDTSPKYFDNCLTGILPGFEIQFENINQKEVRTFYPLPGAYYFPKDWSRMHGYPRPANNGIPQCECGGDKLYGPINSAHSHWCKKGQFLEIMSKYE